MLDKWYGKKGGEGKMTVYKIKGQSGVVELVITLSAESPEQALEEVK
ncbi:hypothetical protein [Brevibacillus daliensis]|nr:hypothetical protein [Brevibacillus daliensis]